MNRTDKKLLATYLEQSEDHLRTVIAFLDKQEATARDRAISLMRAGDPQEPNAYAAWSSAEKTLRIAQLAHATKLVRFLTSAVEEVQA